MQNLVLIESFWLRTSLPHSHILIYKIPKKLYKDCAWPTNDSQKAYKFEKIYAK